MMEPSSVTKAEVHTAIQAAGMPYKSVLEYYNTLVGISKRLAQPALTNT